MNEFLLYLEYEFWFWTFQNKLVHFVQLSRPFQIKYSTPSVFISICNFKNAHTENLHCIVSSDGIQENYIDFVRT